TAEWIAKRVKQCPYGVVGDRLWVKEALRRAGKGIIVYADDGCPAWDRRECAGESVTWPWKGKSLSAMFMPRWASRLTLELTEIRVQRVQEISEADCIAEGIDVGG